MTENRDGIVIVSHSSDRVNYKNIQNIPIKQKKKRMSIANSNAAAVKTTTSIEQQQQQRQPPVGIQLQQNDPKKLVEYLMNDLRVLSTEARKKHNHIKEAAESGQVKVRNISSSTSSPEQLLQNFRSSCTEVLHPFLLGCSSKNPRLVQISLQSIQRLLQFQAIDRNAVPGIVNELWQLTDAECEELKVLQTITPFVSYELLVTDWALAKFIVLAFRLNFSKDSSVINAASAAVRQLFSCVFERVIQEDGIGAVDQPHQTVLPQPNHQKTGQNQQQQNCLAPPTLRPAAADAFLLLRDLCALIRREQPSWLVGVQRIAPILALELLEAVLKNYPSIFFKHPEFAELLKTQICTQIIRMVVGERELSLMNSNSAEQSSGAASNGTAQNAAYQLRPLAVSAALLGQQHLQQHAGPQPVMTTKARDFPIMIRALRICLALITHYHSLLGPQSEVLVHFLLDLLNHSSTSWEAAVAIEVLHKLLAQPNLLRWFSERPDGPKFVELLFSQLATFVRRSLEEAALDGPNIREENFAQPGFVYKNVFLPLDESQLSSKRRSILLDWLDRHSAEKIPEAYCLSVGFGTLIDASNALYSAIEAEHSPSSQRRRRKEAEEGGDEEGKEVDGLNLLEYSDLAKELYLASYGHLIMGLSTLLDFSMDDSLSEHLLNCLSSLTTLACRIGLAEPKHTTIKAICRAALPSHYFAKFIECTSPATLNSTGAATQHPNGSPIGGTSTAAGRSAGSPSEPSVEPTQVVAMGTVCPSPHLPSQYFSTSVMLTAKNLQVARLLINCAHANGQLLGDCWEMALTTIQHFVWIIGLRPTSTGSFRAGGETANPFSADGSGGGSAGVSTTSAGASSSDGGTVILTTAASSELPDLNQQLNSLFESTTQLDECSLHHVIAALCKLSNEAMMVAQVSSREQSYFSIAKLLQTALANLPRLHIFWRPVTAHLLELCAHSNANTREWGALSLTQLVKNAMKREASSAGSSGKRGESAEALAKREQLVLTPLCAINEIDFLDVRTKQLDCLMRILQAENRPLEPQLWPMVVQIVSAVVAPETRIVDPQLIDQGFRALSLVVKEFLGNLPFECVESVIETDALYGQQQFHLNVSLASIGQLWDISDFVRRESGRQASGPSKQRREEAERTWLVIYQALGRLCVDPRPPVRKSACDTLLQTVAAHGQALGTQCWARIVTAILFPMLDRVRQLTQSASTQRSSTNSLGAPNLMIHHSRDTESKQWSETSVKTLGGVVKIFNAQRPVLLLLEHFPSYWAQLLAHIELAAKTDNAEMSLAALKNFQELLFGRPQQTESSMPGGKQSLGGGTKTEPDLSLVPSLPEPLWMVSWSAWFRLAQAIVAPDCPATLDTTTTTTASLGEDGQEEQQQLHMPSTQKHYVPGLYHFSTLLECFLWLFHRLRYQIPVEDVSLGRLGLIFQEIAAVPICSDQLLLSTFHQAGTASGADQQLNMAQECLLTCTRAIIQEQMADSAAGTGTPPSPSSLRAALPDMLRLLLSFAQFAWQMPENKFSALQCQQQESGFSPSSQTQQKRQSQQQTLSGASYSDGVPQAIMVPNLVAFGESSLKMLLEFYAKTANFEEVVQQTVLVDILKKLGEPLRLKYRCPSQSTWQLAATTLNKVCQVGLPVARENVNLFKQLWPTFADTVEGFLFSSSKSQCTLNADERKRHEFMDCLLIELIRAELLPHGTRLPRDFMQRIIHILNRGSINTMDANDVLASDVHQQRTDLSRVCFDALLSLTRMEANSSTRAKAHQTHHPAEGGGGMLRNTSSESHEVASPSLGASAIASLLNRCKQVLNDYARDELSSGHFRLPQERIVETISALRAVSALIEGFTSNPSPTLYSHLVNLHPSLVQLIPASRRDQQVELALMTSLNSYQTLLLLNLHNK